MAKSSRGPEQQANRRISARLPIGEEVRYKILGRGKSGGEVGIDKVLNMSSSGVLFSTTSALSDGDRLELTVSWPARFNAVTRLKLVVLVMRADEDKPP